MPDLAVIVPSRGRPRQLREMMEAVHATAAGDVRVYVGLDDDDRADYAAELLGRPWNDLAYRGVRKSLSAWTNHLAEQALAGAAPPRYLASLGDDHQPRSVGWDLKLIEAIESLDGPGWAYGDDLLQGERVPTAWVQSAELFTELGWMMLPACQHMYVDNAVRELGRAAGRIAYRPGVVIEHLHPAAGKAQVDDTYAATNTAAQYEADGAAYRLWHDTELDATARRVRALRHTQRTGA